MRKLIAGLLIGMLLVWGGAFVLVKTYRDGVASELGAIADQLEVPAAWTVVSEQIEREQFICFNDKPCPALSRIWQADRALDAEDVRKLVEAAGWTLTPGAHCEQGDATGAGSVCSAVATGDGHQIQLVVESPAPGASSRLRLRLNPSNG